MGTWTKMRKTSPKTSNKKNNDIYYNITLQMLGYIDHSLV